jgi:hypothetical protein
MYGKQSNIKDDSSDYHIYYPCPLQELPPIGNDIPPEGCLCVSIDPAIATFAFRIERRYANSHVETICMDKLDFKNYDNTNKSSGSTRIDPRILTDVLAYLNRMLPYMLDARIIVIERQLSVNYKATRIFQHILTFFMMTAPTFNHSCVVMDILTKVKGKVLGAPKNLNYNGLKAWGIEKAIQLLEWRNDQFALDVIKYHKGKSKTKADDLADTVIQIEAWFILVNGVHTSTPANGPFINVLTQ